MFQIFILRSPNAPFAIAGMPGLIMPKPPGPGIPAKPGFGILPPDTQHANNAIKMQISLFKTK